MSKHLARVEDIQNNYRIQRGELFKRIRLSTFAQLCLQVDSVNSMNEGAESAAGDDTSLVVPKSANDSSRGSSFLDVISGMGELSCKDQSIQNALPAKPELPIEQKAYAQM